MKSRLYGPGRHQSFPVVGRLQCAVIYIKCRCRLRSVTSRESAVNGFSFLVSSKIRSNTQSIHVTTADLNAAAASRADTRDVESADYVYFLPGARPKGDGLVGKPL